MRFRVGDIGVTGHVQATISQVSCKRFGVFQHLLRVLILEMIHFVGGHQQAQQGAQVMVADCPWKSSSLHCLPDREP